MTVKRWLMTKMIFWLQCCSCETVVVVAVMTTDNYDLVPVVCLKVTTISTISPVTSHKRHRHQPSVKQMNPPTHASSSARPGPGYITHLENDLTAFIPFVMFSVGRFHKSEPWVAKLFNGWKNGEGFYITPKNYYKKCVED